MMETYIAVVHKDVGTSYGVSFPDFPGCITSADTLEEARDNAREALDMHVQGLKEDGATIPSPSTAAKVADDDSFSDSYATLLVTIRV